MQRSAGSEEAELPKDEFDIFEVGALIRPRRLVQSDC